MKEKIKLIPIFLISLSLIFSSCNNSKDDNKIKQQKVTYIETSNNENNILELNKNDDFIENDNNQNIEELSYEDCGLFYENELLLLLSEIKKYKSLNLGDAEVVDSFDYLDEKHDFKQKNFNGLLIKWFETNGVPKNIILLDCVTNTAKTKRGISVGSEIKEVFAKYGKKEINKNGEVSYWYGSLEFETQIGISFSIENNKVSKIHIQSYD